MFRLNHVAGDRLRGRGAGDVLARTALAFYPARTSDETRQAAGRCRTEPAERPGLSRLALEDGTAIRVDLDALTIEVGVR